MITFMIHTPINSRGYLMGYLKDNLVSLEKEIGEEISLVTPHDYEHTKHCTESWLLPCVKDDTLPDIILTHAGEFADLKDFNLEDHFSTSFAEKYNQDNPVRTELEILKDPKGIFYPLFVVPVSMGYNKKNLDEKYISGSWNDLFNENIKIILPALEKPLTKAFLSFIMENFPEKSSNFFNNISFGNSPVDVVRSIAAGEFDMAVSNISFINMMKNKNIDLNTPKEGVMLLPQVLAWKKNADEKVLKVTELLMKKEIQNYLGEQDFWPSLENSFLGESFKNNELLKSWQGWEKYINSIVNFEKRRGEIW